tara:strand:+ start:1483 stop:2217 length:735 start_codon:yes stop_codon:yes gene_type:complete
MAIRYEINPPKITDNVERLERLYSRIKQISDVCDGIHLTDSVLGIERISPINIAIESKQKIPDLRITISLRVIDKSLEQIANITQASIEANLDGLLVLMGDPSQNSNHHSGIFPSQAVQHLNDLEYNKKTDIFLSLPSNPSFEKISKKVNSKPHGFVTQVIHNITQVQRITNYLSPNGFKIIPCVLFPSEKNLKSAEFLKLDWSNYKDDFSDFINQIEKITGDVLLTSPNDFKGALEFLTQLQN